MAIYGRQRSKWDPTRDKAKTSKNRTYEIKRDSTPIYSSAVLSPLAIDLKNTLWTHLSFKDNSILWQTIKKKTGGNASPSSDNLTRFGRNDNWTFNKELYLEQISSSRFCKAIKFTGKPISVDQDQRQFLRDGNHLSTAPWTGSEYSHAQLFGTANQVGSYPAANETRNLFFSFWIKINSENNDNDGHTFAHWATQGSFPPDTSYDDPDEVKPLISFFVNPDGGIAIRFTEELDNSIATVSPGQYVSATPDFLEVATDSGKRVIEVGKWHYVTFSINLSNGWSSSSAPSDITSAAEIYIDGIKQTSLAITNYTSSSTFATIDQNWQNADMEWQFGDLINSWGTRDSSSNEIKRSSGFNGSLGEFSIISQDCTDANSNPTIKALNEAKKRYDFAKFLYEANTDGVFRLASGIHNSSPRIEQKDLDADDKHPSSYGLNLFTQPDVLGSESEYFTRRYLTPSILPIHDGDRTRLRSQIDHIEGHKSDEEFSQIPSKEYISFQSPEDSVVMPHLRLHPDDRLITSGSWYSDSRTEIFPEDRSYSSNSTTLSSGFVTKYYKPGVQALTGEQTSSDQLYKRNKTLPDHAPFKDTVIPQEFDDCYVIEIPIPNVPKDNSGENILEGTILSTDLDKNEEQGFLGTASLSYIVWEEATITTSVTLKRTGFFDRFPTSEGSTIDVEQCLTEFYQWYLPLVANVSDMFQTNARVTNDIYPSASNTQTWQYALMNSSTRPTTHDGLWSEFEQSQFGGGWNTTYIDIEKLQPAKSVLDNPLSTPLNGHTKGKTWQYKDALRFMDISKDKFYGFSIALTPTASTYAAVVIIPPYHSGTPLTTNLIAYPNGQPYLVGYAPSDQFTRDANGHATSGIISGVDTTFEVANDPLATIGLAADFVAQFDQGLATMRRRWKGVHSSPDPNTGAWFPSGASTSSPWNSYGSLTGAHVEGDGKGPAYGATPGTQSSHTLEADDKPVHVILVPYTSTWFDAGNTSINVAADKDPSSDAITVDTAVRSSNVNYHNSAIDNYERLWEGYYIFIKMRQHDTEETIADRVMLAINGHKGSTEKKKTDSGGDFYESDHIFYFTPTNQHSVGWTTSTNGGSPSYPSDYGIMTNPLWCGVMNFRTGIPGMWLTKGISYRIGTHTDFDPVTLSVNNLMFSDTQLRLETFMPGAGGWFDGDAHGYSSSSNPTSGLWVIWDITEAQFWQGTGYNSVSQSSWSGHKTQSTDPMIPNVLTPAFSLPYINSMFGSLVSFQNSNHVHKNPNSSYNTTSYGTAHFSYSQHTASTDSDITTFDVTNLWEFNYGKIQNDLAPSVVDTQQMYPGHGSGSNSAEMQDPWLPAHWHPDGGRNDGYNPYNSRFSSIASPSRIDFPWAYSPTDEHSAHTETTGKASHWWRRTEIDKLPAEISNGIVELERLRKYGLSNDVLSDGVPSQQNVVRQPNTAGDSVNVTFQMKIRLRKPADYTSVPDGNTLPALSDIKGWITGYINGATSSASYGGGTTASISSWVEPTDWWLYGTDGAAIEIPDDLRPSAISCSSSEVTETPVLESNPSPLNTGQQIQTMAYYNFKQKKWVPVVNPYSTDPKSTTPYTPEDIDWVEACDIGFTPMTGIILPSKQSSLDRIVQLYGRPTTDFGFPFHRKFKPKEGETIDLSQYIHEPVILKGWEIKQKVIPRVGYQHDDMTGYSSSATNVEASGTETGPAGDYYQTSIASRSPFYYGGHGEAAVYYDGETEIGPFRELFVHDETIGAVNPNTGLPWSPAHAPNHPTTTSTGQLDRYEYNKTVPVAQWGIPEEGIPFTDNAINQHAKGFVTKGVTAFLLRERDLVNKDIIVDNFYGSEHMSSFVSNIVVTGSEGSSNNSIDPSYGPQNPSFVPSFNVHTGLNSGFIFNKIDDSTSPDLKEGTDPDGSGPLLPVPPDNINESAFLALEYGFRRNEYLGSVDNRDGYFSVPKSSKTQQKQTSRDMIGYLQHVYHNDPSGSLPRNHWYRVSDNANLSEESDPNWSKPNYSDIKNLISLLGRENDTFVGPKASGCLNPPTNPNDIKNLLRENVSDTYYFHVSGSMKLNAPLAGSFPLSVFRMKANSLGAIGLYDSSETTVTARVPFYAQSIFPSDIGRPTNSSLISERTIPSVSSVKNPTSTVVPNALYPLSGNAVLPDHTSVISIAEPETKECEVVLAPSDRIILGIQDSIATTFASQQAVGGVSAKKFVRWGRNKLQIPFQQHGAYLRLFVQHQRRENSIDVRSNQTNEFSDSVHREIGDLIVDDQYMVEPLTAYSGSMGDDIVAPVRQIILGAPVAQLRYSAFIATAGNTLTSKALADGASFWEEWHYYDVDNSSVSDWSTEITNGTKRKTTWDGVVPWNASNLRTTHRAFPNSSESGGRINAISLKRGSYNQTQFDFGLDGVHQWCVVPDPSSFPHSAPGYPERRDYKEGVYLSELNPRLKDRDTAYGVGVTDLVRGNGNINLEFNYTNNPAISSYSLKMPLYYAADTLLGTNLGTINVEFRLVKLSGNVQGYSFDTNGASSSYSFVAGDAFFFNAGGLACKVDYNLLSSSSDALKFTQRFKNDSAAFGYIGDFLGNHSAVPANYDGKDGIDIIYIVAATGTMNPKGYLPETSNTYIVWQDVIDAISKTLKVQKIANPALLYNVYTSSDGFGGHIELEYPEDSDFTELIRNTIRNEVGGGSIHYTAMRFGGAMMALTGNGSQLASSSSTSAPYNSFPFNSKIVGWYPPGGPGLQAGTSTTIDLSDNSATAIDGIVDFLKEIDTSKKGYEFFSSISSGEVTMDTSTMPRWGFVKNTKSSANRENNTERINKLIARKVLYRSTKGTAGSYGSLQKTTQLTSGDELIYDSGVPTIGFGTDASADLSNLPYGKDSSGSQLTYIFDGWWPQEERNSNKKFDSFPRITKVKFNPNSSSNTHSEFDVSGGDQNEPSIEYSNLLPDGSTVSTSGGVGSVFPPTAGSSDDYLEVSNLLSSAFNSSVEHFDKTIRSIYFGIGFQKIREPDSSVHTSSPGNTVKYHKINPIITPDIITYIPSADTSLTPTGVFGTEKNRKLLLSPIRGPRFGLYNISTQTQKFHFRSNRYGQFRDMLEQGIDTKFAKFLKDETIYGSPVIVNPINPINPEIPKLMSGTQRFNQRQDCTIVKPYIEGKDGHNINVIVKPTMLNSESLRVDVPGSIRTRAVTAPGNIAQNIRTRS